MVGVQTSCTLPEGQRRIAPPRVLGRWVERLQLDDAGIAVLGEPHSCRTTTSSQCSASTCLRAIAGCR
jgi:hypothetical protein